MSERGNFQQQRAQQRGALRQEEAARRQQESDMQRRNTQSELDQQNLSSQIQGLVSFMQSPSLQQAAAPPASSFVARQEAYAKRRTKNLEDARAREQQREMAEVRANPNPSRRGGGPDDLGVVNRLQKWGQDKEAQKRRVSKQRKGRQWATTGQEGEGWRTAAAASSRRRKSGAGPNLAAAAEFAVRGGQADAAAVEQAAAAGPGDAPAALAALAAPATTGAAGDGGWRRAAAAAHRRRSLEPQPAGELEGGSVDQLAEYEEEEAEVAAAEAEVAATAAEVMAAEAAETRALAQAQAQAQAELQAQALAQTEGQAALARAQELLQAGASFEAGDAAQRVAVRDAPVSQPQPQPRARPPQRAGPPAAEPDEDESAWLQRLDRELDAIFNTSHEEEAEVFAAAARRHLKLPVDVAAAVAAAHKGGGSGGGAGGRHRVPGERTAGGAAEAPAVTKKGAKKTQFRRSMFQPRTAVTCSGWLEKKGKVRWQRRWFQVAGHYMTYRTAETDQELKGSVDLQRVVVDEMAAGTPVFHLRDGANPAAVVMTLRASSMAEADLWAGAIREVSDAVLRKDSFVDNKFRDHTKLRESR
eukprot:g107.t1